jgi:hypothetical protein
MRKAASTNPKKLVAESVKMLLSQYGHAAAEVEESGTPYRG